jgi:hypothetical protein
MLEEAGLNKIEVSFPPENRHTAGLLKRNRTRRTTPRHRTLASSGTPPWMPETSRLASKFEFQEGSSKRKRS